MKINGNSMNAVSAYIHTQSDNVKRKIASYSDKKTLDRMELSDAGRAALERNAAASALKAEAVRAVKDPASPERIAALRESVVSGNYSLSDDNIAGAVLDSDPWR